MHFPVEDVEGGMRGRLRKAMWGTRDAAQIWEMEYTEMTLEAKLEQGAYCACVFYRKEKNVRVVVHGDDSIALGAQ